MTYLTIHHLDSKECFGKSIQKTLYASQKLSLFEWLREFNPCGKIHHYALAAFNEGLCFDDVVIECQIAFNDINIENIKSIVMMVSRKYKSAKLN
jgi:hypothetical protein